MEAPQWSGSVALYVFPPMRTRPSTADDRDMTTTAEQIKIFGRLQSHPTNPRTPESTSTPSLSDLPGFGGLIQLSDQHGGSVTLSLWRSREDAELVDERRTTEMPPMVEDQIYEVDDTLAGPAAGLPTAAFLGRFDGPLSTAQHSAARRRGNKRLGPLLAQLPGFVRVLILWHPIDRSMVVIHLAETPEALRGISKVVAGTPLDPEDDPALLPGPDRIGLNTVDHYTWLLTDPARAQARAS